MQASRDHEADDLLTRAVQALRGTPIPEGPSNTLAAETLAALRTAVSRPRVTRWRSKAVAVLGLAASGLVLWAVLNSPAATSIALAQVIERLAAAKSLTFDMLVDAPQGKFPALKATLTFAQPGKMRADVQDPKGEGVVASLIGDLPAGKNVLISAKTKTVIVGLIKGADPSMWKDSMLDQLRSMAAKESTDLGEKDVDGVRAKGFELTREHFTMRIWANSKTGDPMRVEIKGFYFPPPLGKADVVWTNFRLSDHVDPAFFDTTPPEGYLVIKAPVEIDLTSVPTDHLRTILQEYSKRMDGAFPPQISDLGESIFQELERRHGPLDDQQAAQHVSTFNPLLVQLNSYLVGHKPGKDYQYYPGRKLGEKDQIVFWFRDDKTGKYTAIYGDLRVEEVAKDQLPATGDQPTHN